MASLKCWTHKKIMTDFVVKKWQQQNDDNRLLQIHNLRYTRKATIEISLFLILSYRLLRKQQQGLFLLIWILGSGGFLAEIPNRLCFIYSKLNIIKKLLTKSISFVPFIIKKSLFCNYFSTKFILIVLTVKITKTIESSLLDQ